MKRVIRWYQEHHRDFPFRTDPTPYHVWISEIMLQQTRMETVIPYYERFIREVPDVYSLSILPDEKLMKLWEGLGYYSRARNLKKAALEITENYQGKIPETEEELVKLPGIGPYTAAAIASIAFHEAVPVVDGNVLRIVSRFYMLSEDVLSDSAKKNCYSLLLRTIRENDLDAALFNQGMMELGEVVCLPKKDAACDICPLKSDCLSYIHDRVADFPVRKVKTEKIQRDLTVWIFKQNDKTAVCYRTEKDVLKNMYGFPVTDRFLTLEEAAEILRENHVSYKKICELEQKKHVFTHRIWNMKAFFVEVAASEKFTEFENQKLLFASEEEMQSMYALPSAFKKWKR